MRRGDLWLIALFVLIVAIFMLPRYWEGEEKDDQGITFARVTVDGELFEIIELTEEDQQIEIRTERGFNLLRVYERGIEVVDADCRDRICESYGWIHEVGQTIVCLPNRVFVEIVGEPSEGEEMDGFVN